MRTTVAEYQSGPISLAQNASVTLNIPLKRMRQQGRGGVLRADAYKAQFVDEARLRLVVRGATAAQSAGLQAIEATYQIRRYMVESGTNPNANFPNVTVDVSGLLQALGGVLDFDLSDEAVWEFYFVLTNRASATFSGVVNWSLTGEPTPRDLAAERGPDPVVDVPWGSRPSAVGNEVDSDRDPQGG